jgi:hypothetical protein
MASCPLANANKGKVLVLSELRDTIGLILLSQDYDNTLQGYQDFLLFSLLIFSSR